MYLGGGAVALFPTDGSGSNTIGYRLGYASGSSAYLIVAPKSTEVKIVWGSSGTTRGTTSTTDGALNTGTLYGFGSAAHPAAYHCRAQTTGGYNTWYLPAKSELNTMYSNKSATPFASTNSFDTTQLFWSSTENNGIGPWNQSMSTGVQVGTYGKANTYNVRPVRQYYAPDAIGGGSATTGFWLGTAGDGVSKLIVAPKSVEVNRGWGSYGTVRNTTSTTDGVGNTNTLYSFGSALATGHPAAYYTKTLTTGGYNTWYLPAKAELNTMYSNKSATPFFSSGNQFGSYYWSSTEVDGNIAWCQSLADGGQYSGGKGQNRSARATRRSTV